jgi:hypothetical protein
MKAGEAQNNSRNLITFFKIIPLLITFFFVTLNICHAQEKSPIEVVKLFDKAYGSPSMDEIANYTTPKFRDNRPKSVWVVDTWKTLKEIKYEKLNSSVIDTKIKADKAIVATEGKIKTVVGETTQKEIFYLVKKGGRWLIDQLIVTDEEIDLNKIKL